MYRYALRPRWLLSHLFALFVVVLFVYLGLWQLRRHDERADRNAIVDARAEQAPAPLDELLDGTDDAAEELQFRSATTAGTYDDVVLLVDNRSRDGLPGAWVLSPLRTADGTVVVVNRGFLPSISGRLDAPAPAPGPVSVLGTVAPFADRSCPSRADEAGVVVGVACPDRDVVEAAFGAEVAPVVVQRVAAEPAEAELLSPVPLPELGSGPHRGYAGQWFIFATIVAVVYVLILRKVARERARPDGGEAPAPVGGPDDRATTSV